VQFIDTSSKFGHGRFQTYDEKLKAYGRTKN
jgi:large subunit ribosomal protein L3e